MQTSKQEQLEALAKLISLMSAERALSRDLQLTFEDIEEYIKRNIK